MFNNGMEETHKVLYHYSSSTVFNDIILIINFYDKDLNKLKEYMYKLYQKSFPNIVFISSTLDEYNDYKGNHILSCPEASDKSLSYICIEKVYKNYPNMKGYLYLNNEILLKIWELDNFNLSIPWLCSFNISDVKSNKYNYTGILNIINKNEHLKKNLTKFLGKDGVAEGMPHFYYVTNDTIVKFFKILKIMYENKVPEELAIPNTMGMMLYPHYQYIYFADLTQEEIKTVMTYIKRVHEQILVYPVDYTKANYRKEVDKYIYFMKAEDY